MLNTVDEDGICTYSDLPPTQCDHCRANGAYHETFKAERLLVKSRTCSLCGGTVQVGDLMYVFDGEPEKYCSKHCARKHDA